MSTLSLSDIELTSETEYSFEDDSGDIDHREGIRWPLEEAVVNSWIGCRITRSSKTKIGRNVSVTEVRIGKVW